MEHTCPACHSWHKKKRTDDRWVPMYQFTRHCSACKDWVDCPYSGCPHCAFVVPGSAVVVPAGAVAQPGSAVAQPGSAVAQPGSAVAQPGSAVVQPGAALSSPGVVIPSMGYTRDQLAAAKAAFDCSKGYSSQDRVELDTLPLILRKVNWVNHYNSRKAYENQEAMMKFLKSLEPEFHKNRQALATHDQEIATLKQAVARQEPGAVMRFSSYTRDELLAVRTAFDCSKGFSEQDLVELDRLPEIIQKTNWLIVYDLKNAWRQRQHTSQRVTELEQALATQVQETATLKQALATQEQETATLKQALATQEQETATLKQALSTMSQENLAVQANADKIMESVQQMLGPMQAEMAALRDRVAELVDERPLGLRASVKKEPKDA